MVRTPKPVLPRTEESTPTAFPETTPPRYTQPTHDFTLQAIMELQKTVGQLGTKVELARCLSLFFSRHSLEALIFSSL